MGKAVHFTFKFCARALRQITETTPINCQTIELGSTNCFLHCLLSCGYALLDPKIVLGPFGASSLRYLFRRRRRRREVNSKITKCTHQAMAVHDEQTFLNFIGITTANSSHSKYSSVFLRLSSSVELLVLFNRLYLCAEQ